MAGLVLLTRRGQEKTKGGLRTGIEVEEEEGRVGSRGKPKILNLSQFTKSELLVKRAEQGLSVSIVECKLSAMENG